jgi:phosphatidate phosphatase APP1
MFHGMHNHSPLNSTKNTSFISRVKSNILHWLRLTNQPVVKVYHGYGNKDHLFIFGHVFALSPIPRKRFSGNIFTNAFALLRLFMVRPLGGAKVQLEWRGRVMEAISEKDGFFKFEWEPGVALAPGWHDVHVQLLEPRRSEAQGKGVIFIPDEYQFACISDIDDTFLISHSANLPKRLQVLFTENAHSRQPFDGVVRHYQLLADAADGKPNPFFYVSSSEWNLYDYIVEFSHKNELPRGVYLLGQVKRFKELLKTGQNKHSTKFMRIARILHACPGQPFILLGDDSQQDPIIYSSVIEHFPEIIRGVYLRHIHKKNKTEVQKIVDKINGAGIPCCYFEHSREAIEHSKQIGLITPDSA